MPGADATPTTPASLWRGRVLALLGIIFVASSLRLAVASLSPLVDLIGESFPLPASVVGLIGTAPPICYAIFGLATPWLEKRIGLEPLMAIALVIVTIGTATRAMATDATMLLLSTAVLFAGVGIGNILLPPLVKKYFPDRIGLMMTIYTTIMAIVTTLPALVAVPLATATDWRTSLGIWTIFSGLAVVPWVVMILKERVAKRAPVSTATGAVQIVEPDAKAMSRLMRVPLVWALVAVFGTSATSAYTMFAWLPQILTERADVSMQTAGTMLAVFAFMGLPASLVVPMLVVRFQATRGVFLVSIIGGILGVLGLTLAPTAAPWLWVFLLGFIGALFPMSLVLISIRSRGADTAVPLSGIVQSVGYLYAAAWPVLFGLLHEWQGNWTLALILLGASFALTIPAGLIASRPGTVEAAWEKRHGSW